MSRFSISDFFITRLARPEGRTGTPYILFIHRIVAGLPHCFLARPTGKTDITAFLMAENLAIRLGRLPWAE